MQSQSSESTGKTTVTDLAIQACLTLLCTALLLRIWRTDLRVPFNYWGDTIFELTLVKSIAQNGWIWFIERLGAPFGLDIVAFPQNLTTSSTMMKLISIFTSEPGLILNIFWITSIALTSVFCHTAMRSLGIARSTGLVTSTLYALMPYALYRNTAHISLTYIFIPIIAAFSIDVLANNRYATKDRTYVQRIPTAPLMIAGLCIGFDYIYSAFFSCFFLGVAGLFGAISGKSWNPITKITPLLVILIAGATINFLPSLLNWQEMGVPPNMGYKSPAEAEVYGLKIRHVVSPLSINIFSGTSFPLENENQFSKLGIVGAIGFIAAIIFGLLGGTRRYGGHKWSAGVLTIAGILLATVGGFGAIFNTLVSPDIRAYNRIIVFLGFFSFFIVATQLDHINSTLKGFFNIQERPYIAHASFAALLAFTLLLGLIDQGKAAHPLIEQYKTYDAQMRDEKNFVQQIENRFLFIESVYQLPKTNFPPDGGIKRMQTYDHGRPFLWSQRLHWSWPSFSQRHQNWENTIGKPGTLEFTTNLAISGFTGLWLDRHGYTLGELKQLERDLSAQLGAPLAVSGSGRYALFSLERPLATWKESNTKQQQDQAKNNLLEINKFQSNVSRGK
jgi:phosphoglycerol transferase